MSHPVRINPRSKVARLALTGALGAASLAITPAALASPASGVRLDVKRADVALHAVASAAASGRVSAPISVLTGELGGAAKLSVKLAVHAKSPSAVRIAAQALSLVAAEEAKAQGVLNAELSAVSGAASTAVVKADLEVTQGEELALSVTARLASASSAAVKTITDELATLSGQATGLLGQLVVDTTPDTISCPSASAFAKLVASDAASMQTEVPGVGATISAISGLLNAGGSLLANVTADEAVQVDAQVQADVTCQPDSGGDTGSGSASGAASASASSGLLGGLGL